MIIIHSPSKSEFKLFLEKHYAYSNNKLLAKQLGISESTLIRKASKLGIKKSKKYLEDLHKNLMEAKKKNYEQKIKPYEMSQVERNIIIGSLLGDGSLALYGRSKHAYYREHGCDSQIPYRKWKAQMLQNLDFRFNEACKYGKLSSPSHPLYTDLYNKFYKDKIKILNPENIKLLDHPIGLACLYMDDGSLVISTSKNNNKIYLTPIIYIYSLNFTKDENLILMNHIKNKFGIEFKLKQRPDGKNFILQLSKRNELMKFIDLVKPYVEEIPCMYYKIDVHARLIQKSQELLSAKPDKEVVMSKLQVINHDYSTKDELLIISLKKSGVTDQEIANELKRSYWGIVDKIRRLRKEGRL